MRYKCLACGYEFESINGIPYCPSCDNETLEEIEDTFIQPSREYDENHHIWPKFMGNKNGDGEQFVISRREHLILHGKIMNWIWEEIRECDKKKIIDKIIMKSKRFIGVYDDTNPA